MAANVALAGEGEREMMNSLKMHINTQLKISPPPSSTQGIYRLKISSIR